MIFLLSQLNLVLLGMSLVEDNICMVIKSLTFFMYLTIGAYELIVIRDANEAHTQWLPT